MVPRRFNLDRFHCNYKINNEYFITSGNSNLIYTIIRKRNVFHQLANLPVEHSAIAKALSKRGKKFVQLASSADHKEPQTMEGAMPASEAEPGTLKTSLAATPSKIECFSKL